jgi:hypothetical protein
VSSFTNGPFSAQAGMGWSAHGARRNGKKTEGLLVRGAGVTVATGRFNMLKY